LSGFEGRACPDWYARPQLGIFIHWGMWAAPAWAPRGTAITELFRQDYDHAFALGPYAEWYPNAMRVADSPTALRHAELYGDQPYEAFRAPFEAAAEAFDAEAWARLFEAAGASYVVFVAKHHDGFCLWPTEVENPHRPGWHSERDFVGELAQAVRARGLRFGIYYSGGLDWSFHHLPISNLGDMFACVPPGEDYRAYAAAQARELIGRYRPSVLWNDIAWPDGRDLPGLFADYYAAVPDGVINDRWTGNRAFFDGLRDPAGRAAFNAAVKARLAAGGDGSAGGPPRHPYDFRTVEYDEGRDVGGDKWESTRGIGLAFGYNANEAPEDLMSAEDLIGLYRDVTGRGGNLLINVGPRADASIPEEQAAPLEALGRAIRG
jgi:alpha-L-fucosidase